MSREVLALFGVEKSNNLLAVLMREADATRLRLGFRLSGLSKVSPGPLNLTFFVLAASFAVGVSVPMTGVPVDCSFKDLSYTILPGVPIPFISVLGLVPCPSNALSRTCLGVLMTLSVLCCG